LSRTKLDRCNLLAILQMTIANGTHRLLDGAGIGGRNFAMGWWMRQERPSAVSPAIISAKPLRSFPNTSAPVMLLRSLSHTAPSPLAQAMIDRWADDGGAANLIASAAS
jgi:hypothetical protein